jgi:hypothetical protein
LNKNTGNIYGYRTPEAVRALLKINNWAFHPEAGYIGGGYGFLRIQTNEQGIG